MPWNQELGGGATSLAELDDVDGSVTPGKGVILVGDGSVFKAFSPGADGEVITYDSSEALGLLADAISSGGGLTFKGNWDADANSPALSDGTGTEGDLYIVSTAGTTSLDGISDWEIGDFAIFDGSAWQQVDNTDAVTSVNGMLGTVTIDFTTLTGGTLAELNALVSDATLDDASDPRTPTAHASTHEAGGSDEITGTALEVTRTTTNYAETANTLGGHLEGIDSALGTIAGEVPSNANAAPPDIAATGSVGTTTTEFALEDHTHGHGNQAGGALHAEVVAGGDAGFMSGADKTKLDGIEAGAEANVNHASEHEAGGGDEITGVNLEVTRTTTNYTETGNTLGGHLAGLDTAIGAASGISESAHRTLEHFIHLADAGGPMDGFGTALYEDVIELDANGAPRTYRWYLDDIRQKPLFDRTVKYDPVTGLVAWFRYRLFDPDTKEPVAAAWDTFDGPALSRRRVRVFGFHPYAARMLFGGSQSSTDYALAVPVPLSLSAGTLVVRGRAGGGVSPSGTEVDIVQLQRVGGGANATLQYSAANSNLQQRLAGEVRLGATRYRPTDSAYTLVNRLNVGADFNAVLTWSYAEDLTELYVWNQSTKAWDLAQQLACSDALSNPFTHLFFPSEPAGARLLPSDLNTCALFTEFLGSTASGTPLDDLMLDSGVDDELRDLTFHPNASSLHTYVAPGNHPDDTLEFWNDLSGNGNHAEVYVSGVDGTPYERFVLMADTETSYASNTGYSITSGESISGDHDQTTVTALAMLVTLTSTFPAVTSADVTKIDDSAGEEFGITVTTTNSWDIGWIGTTAGAVTVDTSAWDSAVQALFLWWDGSEATAADRVEVWGWINGADWVQLGTASTTLTSIDLTGGNITVGGSTMEFVIIDQAVWVNSAVPAKASIATEVAKFIRPTFTASDRFLANPRVCRGDQNPVHLYRFGDGEEDALDTNNSNFEGAKDVAGSSNLDVLSSGLASNNSAMVTGFEVRNGMS